MEKKLKIAVLGYTGMLGHMVTNVFKSKFKVYAFGRTINKIDNDFDCVKIDIKDLNSIYNDLEILNVDYVINCIGLLVNNSEKNKDDAIYINSYFPHVINDFSKKLNFKFIHISTDCVFSGKSNFFYSDKDFPDAKDFYGITKSVGEKIIDNSLVIRTSIIGPDIRTINSQGLFNWFVNSNENINGYVNVMWSGLTTLELANVILFYIDNFKPNLVQISNGEAISKYNLLVLINKIFKLNKKITPNSEKISSKCLKPSQDTPNVKSYFEMINNLFDYMSNEKLIYKKFIN